MKYTFGKTAAALRLEELVENNPPIRRRISSLLSKYTNQLLLITQMRDPETVRVCMELLRDHTLNRLDSKHLPTEILTYTKNIVITRYRAFRRGFEQVIKVLEATRRQQNKKTS